MLNFKFYKKIIFCASIGSSLFGMNKFFHSKNLKNFSSVFMKPNFKYRWTSDSYINSKERLVTFTGPMYSGKTTALIQSADEAEKIFNLKVIAFKPNDSRYTKEAVLCTHNYLKFPSKLFKNIEELKEELNKHPEKDVFIFDEVQFYNNEIIPIIHSLRNRNKKIFAAGLDTDFRGIPFGPMPYLLAIADKVIKKKGINGETNTQRLIDGKPADAMSPIVLVGGKEAYIPVARKNHVIPGEEQAWNDWVQEKNKK